MSDAERVLLRLKERLGVASDKALADLLGMGEKALNARKKRGASMRDKVLSLAADHPEIQLDVDYILTGEEGGYVVARTASLLQVMKHFDWQPRELAGHSGMNAERAKEFVGAFGTSAGFRLRRAEAKLLIEEWRVRREFLTQGVLPMLRSDDDVEGLAQRLRRVEDQLAALTAVVQRGSPDTASAAVKRASAKKQPKQT